MMPLPHRLPRSEIGWQVPPWATRAEPPRDAFQYQTMVTESVAPLALIRWHHRFDSRPELIRNHTHPRHRSIVAGQRLPIRETRPRQAGRQQAVLARMALAALQAQRPAARRQRWIRALQHRISNPDGALAELGQTMTPPMTKHAYAALLRRALRGGGITVDDSPTTAGEAL
jgi:hypothetical protein